jgi:uncharacterized protein YlxP (DUF503 family)
MSAYVCLVEIRIHIGDSHDLKGKRKLLHSLKDTLRGRFGAAVAETAGHEKWQSSTLLCALVGDAGVSGRADALCRYVESRVPGGCTFERDLRALSDLRS